MILDYTGRTSGSGVDAGHVPNTIIDGAPASAKSALLKTQWQRMDRWC
jgi:hypothetical protein